jgi:hypothetical protein
MFECETSRFEFETWTFETETSRFELKTWTFESETSRFQFKTWTFESETSRFKSETWTFESETPRFESETWTFESETPRFESETWTFQSETSRFEFKTWTFRCSTRSRQAATDASPPGIRIVRWVVYGVCLVLLMTNECKAGGHIFAIYACQATNADLFPSYTSRVETSSPQVDRASCSLNLARSFIC